MADEPWLRRDWLGAFLLFSATAAVVVWQNLRLAVLWDLTNILEHSYRISIGDVPYRDFPFPFAPLTFLTQAALIKLTGRIFFHHVIYCAVLGGLATVLTWRIMLNLLRGRVTLPWTVATLLSVPLTALGIYSVFPHPFYDPDCTFVILLNILLLQQLERKEFPPLRAFLVGTLLVVPLFIKQNTGLAFLGSAGLAFAVLMALESSDQRAVRGYTWMIAGAAAAVVAALLLIHLSAGLENYVRWTVEFTTSRRTPKLKDMLAIYQDRWVPWWIAAFLAGILLLWFNRRGKLVLGLLSGFLMSLPFAWTLLYLFIGRDASKRLLALWPFVLVVALVMALLSVRRQTGTSLTLPYILVGTVLGAFVSQQLLSTYAIWPLLILLVAGMLAALAVLLRERLTWQAVPFAAVVAMSMLVTGGHYVWTSERLNFANVSEGAVVRSSFPALAGLSVRGPWIPQFEELVRFTEREIPPEDGLVIIPGEDPFYYTTGRRPRLPLLMFDYTINPYSPEEIVALSRERGIRWMVVKRKLQLEGEPVQDKDRLLRLLRKDFEQVASLRDYDVYRRNSNRP